MNIKFTKEISWNPLRGKYKEDFILISPLTVKFAKKLRRRKFP